MTRMLVGLAASALLVAGCGDRPADQDAGNTALPDDRDATDLTAPGTEGATGGMPGDMTAGPTATVTLAGTQGNTVSGTLTLTQEGSNVRVAGDITGLTPGDHGFHVHEKGDCSAPDASSAGEHLNPDGSAHGNPVDASHHLGDMLNATADDQGRATIDQNLQNATLSEGAANSIAGKAIIVHAGADDYQTQPSGNSGARVACGVIEPSTM